MEGWEEKYYAEKEEKVKIGKGKTKGKKGGWLKEKKKYGKGWKSKKQEKSEDKVKREKEGR